MPWKWQLPWTSVALALSEHYRGWPWKLMWIDVRETAVAIASDFRGNCCVSEAAIAADFRGNCRVGVDSPKLTVSCRLGAYCFYLGCSTTEHVLSSVYVSRGAHSFSFAFSFSTPAGVGQPIVHELNI